jgi:hypothetical protein
MSSVTRVNIETRIALLAERLGFSGPNATEQVLGMALDYLDDSIAEPKRLYTRERRDASEQDSAAAMDKLGYLDHAAGRPKSIPP